MNDRIQNHKQNTKQQKTVIFDVRVKRVENVSKVNEEKRILIFISAISLFSCQKKENLFCTQTREFDLMTLTGRRRCDAMDICRVSRYSRVE